jgi:hypothetical protein
MLQCRGNVWIQGKMIADICWPKSGCSMLQLHLLLGFAVPEPGEKKLLQTPHHHDISWPCGYTPGIKRGAAGWFTHSNLNFRGDFPCKFSPSLRRWGPRCFSRMFCAFLARHVPLSTMAKPACVRFGGSETGPGVTYGYVKTWLLGSVIVRKCFWPHSYAMDNATCRREKSAHTMIAWKWNRGLRLWSCP